MLGYTTASDSSHTIPSIVAEPETKSVAFPAVGSQQRAGTAAPTPSLSLSLPGADSDDDGEALEDQEEDDDDFVSPGAPRLRVNGSGATASKRNSRPLAPSDGQSGGLLPPPSTVKVVKAPKGRVRVEKGFSQLDWAKLNRTGEVDLTVRPRFRIWPRIASERLRFRGERYQCYFCGSTLTDYLACRAASRNRSASPRPNSPSTTRARTAGRCMPAGCITSDLS